MEEESPIHKKEIQVDGISREGLMENQNGTMTCLPEVIVHIWGECDIPAHLKKQVEGDKKIRYDNSETGIGDSNAGREHTDNDYGELGPNWSDNIRVVGQERKEGEEAIPVVLRQELLSAVRRKVYEEIQTGGRIRWYGETDTRRWKNMCQGS